MTWTALITRVRGLFRGGIQNVETLHRHWSTVSPRGGEPDLLIERIHRSAALAKLIADVPRTARIIEIGSGPGRNLAYLFDAGWERVEGVEINPNAVALMRERYPHLADQMVHVGPAEDVLLGLPSDGYDLVFTMAVLEHIHPASSIVFDQMARIAREILAIEPRGHASKRQYPHDVPGLFTSRGFELVAETPMSQIEETADDPYMGPDYIAWRFRRRA